MPSQLINHGKVLNNLWILVVSDMNWYEEYIEAGIKKEVILLRDNGFNTECSCAHKMYIQCQYISDGEIKRLHELLFNSGYRDYTISIELRVVDGYSYPSLQVEFNR